MTPRSNCSTAIAFALLSSVAATQGNTSLASILDTAIARTQESIEGSTDIWIDHSKWANAWRVQSEHYEVRTTQSFAFGNEIASGLETMLGHFQKTLGIDHFPSERMKIFVVDDLTTYNQMGDAAQDTTAGHHQSMHGSYYDKSHPEGPVVALYTNNSVYLGMLITHSAAHQYFDLAFSGTPPVWIDEGLAAYFATYWDYGWSVEEFERVRDSSAFVPLSTLVTDSIDRYGADSHARFIEMGMFFYYLLHLREDTRTTTSENGDESGPFRDYVVALLRGRDATALPAHELTQDLRTIESDFRSHQFAK